MNTFREILQLALIHEQKTNRIKEHYTNFVLHLLLNNYKHLTLVLVQMCYFSQDLKIIPYTSGSATLFDLEAKISLVSRPK